MVPIAPQAPPPAGRAAELFQLQAGGGRLQRHVLVHPAVWGEAQLLQLRAAARQKKLRSSGCWIEYFPGTGGLVIAAPHDGLCKPPQIPVRSFGVTVRDTGTKGLAASLALELLRRDCARPHLLVCHLSRRCLDVNRAREQAASHPAALSVWDAYHELLSRACAEAAGRRPGGALLVDVHAQAHWRRTGLDAVEVGTLFPSSRDLQQGDAHLEQFADAMRERRHEGGFTMPRLAAASLASGSSLAGLLRGPSSLGSLLGEQGLLATPSRALPAPCRRAAATGDITNAQLQAATPDGDSNMQDHTSASSAAEEDEDKAGLGETLFFSGSSSYVLATYPGVLDCVQLECSSRLTRNCAGWKHFACAVLNSLAQFWRLHTKTELFPHADQSELLAVKAAEPGGKARAYRLTQELTAPGALPRLLGGASMEALREAGRMAEIATWLLNPDLSQPAWSTMKLHLKEPAEQGLLARRYAAEPSWSRGPLDLFYIETAWGCFDFLDHAAARFEPRFRLQLASAFGLKEELPLAESGDAVLTVMSQAKVEQLELHLLLNLLDEPLQGVLHGSWATSHSALFPGVTMPKRPEGKRKDMTGAESGVMVLHSPLPLAGCKLRAAMFQPAEAQRPGAEAQRAYWTRLINVYTQNLRRVMADSQKHALQCPRAAFYRLCRETAEQRGLATAPAAPGFS